MATKLESRLKERKKQPMSMCTAQDQGEKLPVSEHPLVQVTAAVLALREQKARISESMSKLEQEYEGLDAAYNEVSGHLNEAQSELQRLAH